MCQLKPKMQTIEQIILDIVTRTNMSRGDAFPMVSVCREAEAHQLTRNDVVNCVQGLKNRHLLSASERFTDAFFMHFQGSRAA